MAEVDVVEAIKMLKENFTFLKNGFHEIQQQIKELDEPFVGGEQMDIKILRGSLDMILIHLKLMADTLSDELKIIEIIWQRLDEK